MKRRIVWLSITVVLMLVSMRLVLFFYPPAPILEDYSYSRAVFADHQHLLRLTLSNDAKYRLLTPLDDISPALIAATLLEEDQYFRQHVGINPIALIKAIWHTYFSGSRRLGASTITMQVARMRYGINSKSFSGKIWQIFRALQLECFYSKDQILEAYLNMAPYGNNVEGVGAASLIYFGKTAKMISVTEALTLVVIPQNPSKRVPDKGKLQTVRAKLFMRWLALHPEDKNKSALMTLPLQMQSVRGAPYIAPHFVNEVLAAMPAGTHQINTTLDLRLQQLIERLTRTYISRKNQFGINNAAVLLIDRRDMGIRAQLGSADFFNQAISGQINGTAIKRSPGSTLKPFIYALALDQGLIHPATMLKDVPRSFGRYNPENADGDFVGPISAKDALNLSRNIPAVYLAASLKRPTLYEFLQQAGVSGLKPESYYGLALVLGGAEISMRDLVALYAALANDGVWQRLQLWKQEESTHGKRILSPEASFLVLDMLKDTPRPGVHYGVDNTQALTIAWKTGTSSGYRDAWTIGTFGPYVLAVWLGHFDNHSNPALIGKEIAAPLFFEIANALQTQFGPLPALQKFPERMHLTKIDVCKASGLLPTRDCKVTEPTWFIPGKSPIKTDTIFREIAIDKRSGLRACHFDEYTRFDVYEFWPSDLLRVFKRAGIERRIPPPFDPACSLGSNADKGFAPQILSPQSEVEYVARISARKETIIPFTAMVDADVRNLHWFINATFAGKTTREQSFLWHAQPGKYTVRVVDDYGRADAREIRVSSER